MGRRRRPNLPGAIFHLTARTLDRERLFTPVLRTTTLRVIAAAVPRSGVRLLAVAIMSNHFHLVVQQGEQPLHALMQPVLRRLAHLLQRSHGLEGPIFWRPYGCAPCLDPDHARNAIAYTHLNPVRAKLCADPAGYPWTSHGLYTDRSPEDGGAPRLNLHLAHVLDATHALPLFGRGPRRELGQLRDDYRLYIDWKLAADRQAAARDPNACVGEVVPSPPSLAAGDTHWGRTFSPFFHTPAVHGSAHVACRTPEFVPDLSDIARVTLAAEAPGLTLDLVRGRRGGARYCEIRHRMIRRMHAAGHRNVDIARFVGLSESAVSRVLASP
jgi:REP element-mobilizing transposase RayT